MANSSQHLMGIIAESTYGTIPATPAFTAVRHISTTLGLTKDALIADELRSDRQISDHKYGVKQIGGDIVMELNDDGSTDLLMEMAMGANFTSDVLKNGTNAKSASIYRHFTDLTTDEYQQFTGCFVNTMSLQNAANSKVQMTFGIIGQALSVSDTITTGGSIGSPTTTGMMTGTLGSLNEGGGSSNLVTEVNFTLENGIEIKPRIGSTTTLEPSFGRCNVTGTLTTYFENGTLLNKFVSGISSSLDFTCSDGAGNSYTFDFPNIKYTGGDVPVSGQGAIALTMPFQALYDGAAATTMSITRASI